MNYFIGIETSMPDKGTESLNNFHNSSGWYYARLGGLLGTYNNELYDDLQLPNNSFTESVTELAHSWNIEKGVALNPVENHESKNDTQCEKFFMNKVSPLHPCFSVVSD